jgi:hypothetical protein
MHQQRKNRPPESVALAKHIEGKHAHKDGKQNAQSPGHPEQQSFQRSCHGDDLHLPPLDLVSVWLARLFLL